MNHRVSLGLATVWGVAALGFGLLLLQGRSGKSPGPEPAGVPAAAGEVANTGRVGTSPPGVPLPGEVAHYAAGWASAGRAPDPVAAGADAERFDEREWDAKKAASEEIPLEVGADANAVAVALAEGTGLTEEAVRRHLGTVVGHVRRLAVFRGMAERDQQQLREIDGLSPEARAASAGRLPPREAVRRMAEAGEQRVRQYEEYMRRELQRDLGITEESVIRRIADLAVPPPVLVGSLAPGGGAAGDAPVAAAADAAAAAGTGTGAPPPAP